jgi:hypothetical protein
MVGHVLHGSAKSSLFSYIADGAEETYDSIEAFLEREIHHVGFMKGDPGKLLAGKRHHLRIEVETLNAIMGAQMCDVSASATGYVKQIHARALLVALNQSLQDFSLALIVLEGIDRVV